MTPRPDFIAGNTRLRARLPALLDPVGYDQLTGLSRETAAERLAASSTYRPYLNRDQVGDRQLLEAVGHRLRDLLRGVRGLYGGIAGTVVGVLLARHDLVLHDCGALSMLAANRSIALPLAPPGMRCPPGSLSRHGRSTERSRGRR